MTRRDCFTADPQSGHRVMCPGTPPTTHAATDWRTVRAHSHRVVRQSGLTRPVRHPRLPWPPSWRPLGRAPRAGARASTSASAGIPPTRTPDRRLRTLSVAGVGKQPRASDPDHRLRPAHRPSRAERAGPRAASGAGVGDRIRSRGASRAGVRLTHREMPRNRKIGPDLARDFPASGLENRIHSVADGGASLASRRFAGGRCPYPLSGLYRVRATPTPGPTGASPESCRGSRAGNSPTHTYPDSNPPESGVGAPRSVPPGDRE